MTLPDFSSRLSYSRERNRGVRTPKKINSEEIAKRLEKRQYTDYKKRLKKWEQTEIVNELQERNYWGGLTEMSKKYSIPITTLVYWRDKSVKKRVGYYRAMGGGTSETVIFMVKKLSGRKPMLQYHQEEFIYDWFSKLRNEGLPVTPFFLVIKAKECFPSSNLKFTEGVFMFK